MKQQDLIELIKKNQIPESMIFTATDRGIKRPRQYAAEIMNEPDREKRKTMLDLVPINCRAITETHVRNAFALRNQNRALRR